MTEGEIGMILKKLVVGSLATNCYILADQPGGEAAVVDPAGNPSEILRLLKEDNLRVKYIINTHGHFDHIGANWAMKKITGAPLAYHPADSRSQPDVPLEDGLTLKLGELELKVIETPGHSRGSVSLLVDDKLFCGDLLFAGSVGRTDLEGGSFEALQDSLRKISTLPDETQIYPGHGPATQLKQEKETNPYLQEL